MSLLSWLKPAADAPPPGAALGPAPTSEAEDALLDALAAVVRALGVHAPRIDDPPPEQAEHLMAGWSDHLLLLKPPPDNPAARPGRDLGALRRSVLAWRRREVATVDGAVEGLRGAVWALVRAFNAALGEEAREDAVVEGQLRRLRTAACSGDVTALQREVLDASDTIAASVAERRRAQQASAAALGERVRHLVAALQDARRESLTDGLTRLANRKALDAHLDNVVELSRLVAGRTCLVLVDVDHFKRVNDTWGHPAGDLVLRGVADSLGRTFIRKGDFLARYGGEELTAVLGDTGLVEAAAPVERLLASVRAQAHPWRDADIRVTVSAGVAELRPGEDVAGWLARADQALYAAKREGRDRVVYAEG